MVLLKGYDARGFMFYTNYSSRKGRELIQGGKASFVVFWEGLQRQVGSSCARGGSVLGARAAAGCRCPGTEHLQPTSCQVLWTREQLGCIADCRALRWLPQVRVEGLVEQLPEAESTQYFHSRPRGSQVC